MTIEEILKEPGELGTAAREFVEAGVRLADLASKDDMALAALLVQKKSRNPFRRKKSYRTPTPEEIALLGQEMGQHLAGDNMFAGVKLASKFFLLFGGN